MCKRNRFKTSGINRDFITSFFDMFKEGGGGGLKSLGGGGGTDAGKGGREQGENKRKKGGEERMDVRQLVEGMFKNR